MEAPQVSRDLPKTVEVLLIEATKKHKKLSISFANIKEHIKKLEANKTGNILPAFLKNLPSPECRLTAFAADIQSTYNSEITAAHKEHMLDCLNKIICARKEELENTKTTILEIETQLLEDVDTYLDRVKEVQMNMSINQSETQRKVVAENSKIKNTLSKEYKTITTANIRNIGIEKTNNILRKEKIKAQKEKANDIIVIDDAGKTIEKLIDKKIKSMLFNKKLTSTISKPSKFQPHYNQSSKLPEYKKNVNTIHKQTNFNNPNNTRFKHQQTGHKHVNRNTNLNSAKQTGYNNYAAQRNNKYQQSNTKQQQHQSNTQLQQFKQFQQFLMYQKQKQVHQRVQQQQTKNTYPQGRQQRQQRPPPSGETRDADSRQEDYTKRSNSTQRLRPKRNGNHHTPYLKQ